MSSITTQSQSGNRVWSFDLRERLGFPKGFQLPSSPNIEPRVGRFSDYGLPRLEDIPIHIDPTHPLHKFISKPDLLSSEDFAELLASPDINLSISGYHGGAIPAAVPSDVVYDDPHRYDKNLWLRDWALEAFALYRAGHKEVAYESLQSIMNFLGGPEHRNIITSLHFPENNPKQRFANGGALHCKFAIEDNKLTWCRTGWAHHQTDAFTAFVNAVYRMANLDAENFNIQTSGRNMPLDLRKIDPDPNAPEHILPAIIKALHSVEIWDNSDVGPWEDLSAWQRATGNGLATSMTKEIIKFHERFGWDFLKVSYGGQQDAERFKQTVYELAANCKKALDNRVPEDGYAIECDKRPHDAAMILLLYPFRADLTQKQKISILRTVYANMGERGFSRFLATIHDDRKVSHYEDPKSIYGEPDLFVGEDYFHHNIGGGDFSLNKPGFKPALWGLIEACTGGNYYRDFTESGGIDFESLQYADRHMKRTLTHIVAREHVLHVTGKSYGVNQGRFVIPKGSMSEAMSWDSQKGDYVHNHNDLLMQRAVTALQFERALEATALFEAMRQAA